MNKKNPYSVFVILTGKIIDQSASLERARDRAWEISNEDKNYLNIQLGITNQAEWNQDAIN